VSRKLLPLKNPIRNYPWGSTSALAAIRGDVAGPVPEAELWMGAHPAAPSEVEVNGTWRSLVSAVDENPQAMLGSRVTAAHGPRLPFLLKLLAAAEPLSLQAHPSDERARAGFARENAFGIPLDAPHRSYKDDSHKPELLCALSPFHALVGFREVARTIRLLESLSMPSLRPLLDALTLSPADRALRTFFGLAITASPTFRREIAEGTRAACVARLDQSGEFARELAWGARIGELYPGDPGIVVALALNLVVLAPGEAIYLPAGNLHAYLEGTGVEIMASSDNVLRGGLTTKHVDVPELMDVLDFHAVPVNLVPTVTRGREVEYRTPAPEFTLSRLDFGGEHAVIGPITGPEILVATAGAFEARRESETATLEAGAALFVPAAAGGEITLAGTGTVFRARVSDRPSSP